MGGGGSKTISQTIGYRYYMSGVFGICLKADKLLKIVYGDRVAWTGSAADTEFTVSAYNLYGGDATSGAGGLQGQFYLALGKTTQMANRIMKRLMGDDVYAHRGLVTLTMDKSYVSAFSPMFRSVSCLMQHTSYDWYAAKAVIAGSQINPAHEIRDALINPMLGGQYTPDDIDNASFMAAADTLFAENFGLSPRWDNTDKTETYIQSLLMHINGIRVKDRLTGKIKLKLLRSDYNVDNLPVVGPGVFSRVENIAAIAVDSMVNKITLKYVKMTENGEEVASISQENTANIDAQNGRINSIELTYAHLTDAIPDLAPRILSRELQSRSRPLRSLTLAGGEGLAVYEEGDVFALSWPEKGIEKLVLRVLSTNRGTLDNSEITLACVEDVFGVDLSSIVASPPQSEWDNGLTAPVVPSVFCVFEMPLYMLIAELGYDSAETLASTRPQGIAGSLAASPSSVQRGYTLMYNGTNGWQAEDDCLFNQVVVLPDGLSATATSIAADTSGLLLLKGSLLLIENGLTQEWVRVVSYSASGITINRGMLDTVPRAWGAGSRVWFPSQTGFGVCDVQTNSGSRLNFVQATHGPMGQVTPTTAAQVGVTMAARYLRPYPPAYLQINGGYLKNSIGKADLLTLAWRHRDRTQQADILVEQSAANIGPEAEVTYNVRLYDEKNVLKRTVTGLTGTSYTWNTEAGDCGLTAGDDVVLLHFDTDFADQCGHTLTSVSSPVFSTTQKKWGAASLFLNSSSYLQSNTAADLRIDTTRTYTIECWVYFETLSSVMGIITIGNISDNSSRIQLDAKQDGSVTLYTNVGNATSAAGAIVAGNWYHIAGCCNAGAMSLFIDGVLQGSGTMASADLLDSSRLYIGAARNSNIIRTLNGYIDEVRISKVARYTGNFTPPDAPFVAEPMVLNNKVRVELEAVRGGYTSLQKWDWTIDRV